MLDSTLRVKALLARRDFGAAVTVHGWIKTRRDSKGGFSFSKSPTARR
jgi:aspartyl-tRNA synthetase